MSDVRQITDVIHYSLLEDFGLDVEKGTIKRIVKKYKNKNLTNIKTLVIEEILDNI
mgnify:CR=1 FL=1